MKWFRSESRGSETIKSSGLTFFAKEGAKEKNPSECFYLLIEAQLSFHC